MAIDLLAKGMPRDANGHAAVADLRALNKTSEGQLVDLLSGRSHVYLKQGDMLASIEDAETCTNADPSYEKGHLRLQRGCATFSQIWCGTFLQCLFVTTLQI